MSLAVLERLYRETAATLRAYLVQRSAGDHAAADDLLQDVFLHAARRTELLAAAVSPRAWLFGIARNLAVTSFRRQRATRPLSASVAATTPPDEQLAALREAIAALANRDREILELRLRDELSYAEIADVLNIPIGTVRSRLHHAVKSLRSALRGDEEQFP